MALLTLLLVPAAVHADFTFCLPGSAAGQCSSPSSIAADRETGDVFVADSGNNRVVVFDKNGNFLRAFGWDVIPSGQPGDTGTGFEVCTTATTCKAASAGTGKGQFSGLNSVAIDNDPTSTAHHDVYVFENANSRVQRFHPNGEFVLMFGDGVNQTSGEDVCPRPGFPADICKGGTGGTGAGQFASGARVAVGPGGVVHMADNTGGGDLRVQKFSHEGESTATCSPLPPGGFGENVAGFAVDSDGNFYLANSGVTGAVRKYSPACALLNTFHSSFNIQAIAVDDADNLYVGDSTGVDEGGETAIYAYDPSGAPIHTSYGNGTLKSRAISLAPYEDDLFAVEASSPRRLAFIEREPPGPVVLPFETEASPIGNTSATLRTRVNPEGKATDVFFQYVDDASYQAEGGFASANTVSTNPNNTTPPSIPPDTVKWVAHEATYTIPCPGPGEPGCLEAETAYHFRAVATNADGTNAGPESTFETKPPIELGGIWSTEVGTDSAKLHAEINPTGLPTTAYFEYVNEPSFEASGFESATKTAPIDFGSGTSFTSRAALVAPLAPDTTYRYRYVAENFFGAFQGPEGTLTTLGENPVPPPCPNDAFRTGAAASLPDCRAYEMVSPLEKENGDVIPLFEIELTALETGTQAAVNQSTPEGEAITYSAARAFGDAVSAPYSSQYLAQRDPSAGWGSHSLNPPLGGLSLYEGGKPLTSSPFKGFTEDLCHGWLLQNTDLALAPGAPPGAPNLYRRENCGEERFDLVTTVAPPGFSKATEGNDSKYYPTAQGFSADGGVSAFKAPAKLTPNASEADIYQAYLHDEAGLHLVSVLPSGEAAQTHASVGTAQGAALKRFFDSVAGAVSADGTRVFWSAEDQEPPTPAHTGGANIGFGPSRLHLRINALEEPSAVATIGGLGDLEAGSKEVKGLLAARGKAAITSGSPTATLSEVSVGQFLVGQPVTALSGIPAGTTILAIEGQTLTLSANATATNATVTIRSEGPMPFAVGQEVSGQGIPSATTITAASAGKLVLSKPASEKVTNAALSAASGCTEAEKACTIQITQGTGVFRAANPEATKALYTESTGGGNEDLYELDVEKAIAGEAGARTLIAKNTRGLLGTSEDLSRAYLVSTEPCSGEDENSEEGKAQAGQLNLYLYEAGEQCGAGEMEFIATLAPGAFEGDLLAFHQHPIDRRSRVSPDGMHAAFMSRAPLSGYDNTDAQSGKPDAEVFLYDAEGDELACVSCNPSGARPRGRALHKNEKDAFFAAQIPGWENQWHASRVLSEDGDRLFFESFEALVARDTNQKQDVYEWERAASKEQCLQALGAERHVPASGGCLSLISSGKSSADSDFLDASADGDDVFFATASGLVPQDYGLLDIYDARVGGGFAPPAPPKVPCEGEACQSPPPAPADPTPSTAGLQGQGNATEGRPKRRCPKGKRRVRKAGKVRCRRCPKGKRRVRKAGKVRCAKKQGRRASRRRAGR